MRLRVKERVGRGLGDFVVECGEISGGGAYWPVAGWMGELMVVFSLPGVAEAAMGGDGGGGDFFAQAFDVGVDGAFGGGVRFFPDGFHELK